MTSEGLTPNLDILINIGCQGTYTYNMGIVPLRALIVILISLKTMKKGAMRRDSPNFK